MTFRSPRLQTILAASVIALALVIRVHALTAVYGRVPAPGWVLDLQNVSRLVATPVLPGGLSWSRAPLYPHRDGPPTHYFSDPYTYLEFARQMHSFYAAHYREPLIPFSIKIWLGILHDQDVAVSFASVMFSVLAVLATYLLGAAAFSPWAGLIAALGLAIEFDVISEAISGGRDSGFTFAVMFAAYAMVRYAGKPSTRGAVLMGAASAIAILIRLTSVSFLLLGVLLVLAASSQPWRTKARDAGIAAAVAIVLAGPYFYNCWRTFGDPLYAIDYHTANYLQVEGQHVERAPTAMSYVGSKLRERPFQTLDTMMLGLTSYPFLNKWRGFDHWFAGFGRPWSIAALAGLVLFAGSPAGRLLLLVLLTSLVPYAFTWKLTADWRFTEHAYPIFLIAAAAAVVQLARFLAPAHLRALVRDRRLDRRSIAFWSAVASGIGAIVWIVFRELPPAVVREAIGVHEEGMIQAGDRDGAFFRSGWSAPINTGVFFMRISRGPSSSIALPLPAVDDYTITIRMDPWSPNGQPPSAPGAVHVVINGQPIGDLQMQPTPGRVGSYDIHVPSGVARRGSNRVTLASMEPFALWYLRVHSSTGQISSRPAIEPTPKPRYGYLDQATCTGLRGWAADLAILDTPIDVDVYDGTTRLTTLTAGEFRPDLVDAHLGNGRHAFDYTLPPGVFDGRPHTISVRVAGTTSHLNGSPAAVTCTKPGS